LNKSKPNGIINIPVTPIKGTDYVVNEFNTKPKLLANIESINQYINRHKYIMNMPNYESINGIVMNWSGLFVDHGYVLTQKALTNTFVFFGINNFGNIILSDMIGLTTQDIVLSILNDKQIISKWIELYDRQPNIEDYRKIMNIYNNLMIRYMNDNFDIIDEVTQFNKWIHNSNTKLGIVTDHTKIVSDAIQSNLQKSNIKINKINSVITHNCVKNGSKPNPFMIFRCLEELKVFPAYTVIKIDNTVAGIQEGLNAGCWTVAVSKWSPYGNYTSLDEINNNSYQDIKKRTSLAEETLKKSGAHFVIENIGQIHNVIAKIEDMINGDILIN